MCVSYAVFVYVCDRLCSNWFHQLRKKCVWFPTCILHLTVLLKRGLDMHGLQKCTKSVLFVLRWPFLGRFLAKGYKRLSFWLANWSHLVRSWFNARTLGEIQALHTPTYQAMSGCSTGTKQAHQCPSLQPMHWVLVHLQAKVPVPPPFIADWLGHDSRFKCVDYWLSCLTLSTFEFYCCLNTLNIFSFLGYVASACIGSTPVGWDATPCSLTSRLCRPAKIHCFSQLHQVQLNNLWWIDCCITIDDVGTSQFFRLQPLAVTDACVCPKKDGLRVQEWKSLPLELKSPFKAGQCSSIHWGSNACRRFLPTAHAPFNHYFSQHVSP